jgi:hypothetical protein
MGLLDDAIREHLELKRQRGASDEDLQRAEQEALGPARREPGAEPEGLGPPALEEVPGQPDEPLDEPGHLAEVTELHPEAPPAADQPTAIRSTLPDADEMPEPAAAVPEPPPPPPPVDDPVFADEYSQEPAPADSDDDPLGLEPAVEAEPPGTAKPHGDPMIGDHDDYVVTPAEPVGDPEAEPHGDPLVDTEYEPDEVPVDEQLAGGAPDPDRVRTSILDDPLEQMGPPPAREEPPSDGEQDVLEETPDFLQETPEHDKLWFEQKPPRDFDFD